MVNFDSPKEMPNSKGGCCFHLPGFGGNRKLTAHVQLGKMQQVGPEAEDPKSDLTKNF